MEKIKKIEAIIITALDEVAWLYNIRGSDVPYNPVVHAFGVVTTDSAFIYVDQKKVTPEVVKYMTENGIKIRNYEAVLLDLDLLSSGQLSGLCADTVFKNDVLKNEDSRESKGVENEASKPAYSENKETMDGETHKLEDTKCNQSEMETITEKPNLIWINPWSCCYAAYTKPPSDRVLQQQSSLALSKAIKNLVELDGLRKAHIHDGAIVVSFLAWLASQMQEIYGASSYFFEVKGSNKWKYSETIKLTEISVSDKLEAFHAKQENFKGLSFLTISSVGLNTTIIHYAPKPDTCSELQPDSIYLHDSRG